MADDIVKRLRNDGGHPDLAHPLCIEAADLIEAQQAEIERLRAALEFEVTANNTMSSLITQISNEIERLRQRGDNLHTIAVEMPNPRHNLSWLAWRTQMDNALMDWEEARRG